MKRFRTLSDDRGAAAVEFALVLPVLVLLVLGLMEFSRVYNAQISLSNAAREAARSMAVENDASGARAAAIGAAPSLAPALNAGQVTISPNTCAKGQTVKVTVGYTIDLFTGFFGASLPLTGKGVMRCGG